MAQDLPPPNGSLGKAVRTRRERREHWQREGERSIGRNLALIGALGWTVVVPTLAGIFMGRWLDSRLDSGVFWTLGLLVAGLALGCWLAWKRMHRA
ncbi:MAG: AtpZ/AtpI family protein [Rhodospirillales bacterium]